ncbi:PIN domain-containing protein [Acidihalobacter ferrooxydans]|uniref:PIN domain-containing protein n=1 Tax=Acidihalobacter ferrooxydans TaxID=1765967 RepID=A0A1P8UDD6_9GAMM|nr:PIN domain-containing protein [Acidihalobacter ferrooxydans]APZ41804.1 PIN domain-containing protein [Acidihalobacter ferrooxydans]
MAGSARYTAILDACVLYPASLRDLLLSLARDGLYHARWSERIEDEWMRNLLAQRPDIPEDRLRHVRALMARAVPDSLVTGWEGILDGLPELPDADDRHVLAAAICGHADAIITFNLKDFPTDVLAPFSLEALHPDDFLLNQLELDPIAALRSIKAMRARWRKPPVSAQELAATLEKLGLPMTAARLRELADLI